MGRKYAIRSQEGLHFVTFTVVYWLDIFIRDRYRNVFYESIEYCQKNKGLNVHAYCIMSSHVHLIISANASNKLSEIIRDLKSFTSAISERNWKQIQLKVEESGCYG